MNCNFIKFNEGDFLVKILESKEEREKAFILRHEIFCSELKWVKKKDDGRETDAYDNNSILLGVFDERKELIGIARLIFSYMPMMLEKEFSELVSPFHRIKKDINTAEVTRLGIRKLMRKKSKRQAVMAIYKGIYLWSRWNDVRYLYLVAEKKTFRAFTITGFPCKRIGPVIKLNGGVESIAATLDWREFEKTSKLFSYFLQSNNFQFKSLCYSMATG